MSCTHRFENQLIPNWEIEHLFIGTFNPSWDLNNAGQADYFYGRVRNNFWCILPNGQLVKCQYFVFNPLLLGHVYFPAMDLKKNQATN